MKRNTLISLMIVLIFSLTFSIPKTNAAAATEEIGNHKTELNELLTELKQNNQPSTFKRANVNFRDTNGHWANSEINYLVNRGIIKGYSDNTFRPNNNVTNAQVATMLVRALKLNTYGSPNPGLSDVPTTHSAYKEIATAIDKEMLYASNGKFYPNQPITRANMARALYVAFKLIPDSGIKVTDVPGIHWAKTPVTALVRSYITNLYEDGSFKPNNAVTRGQFSAFMVRSLKNGKNNQATIRGSKIGMTKEEVQQIETANLSYSSYTDLIYNDITHAGFPAEMIYKFENDRLTQAAIFIKGANELTLKQLESLFYILKNDMYYRIPWQQPSYMDESWLDDDYGYSISALWMTPAMDTFLNIKINDDMKSTAGILFK